MNDFLADDWRTAWAFNVIDEYKPLSVEEIRQKVKDTSLPFAVCMQNIQGDFNISTVIRNANAFGAREVFYIGKKKFDRRGAMGVYHYTPVIHLSSHEELITLKEKYTFVGVDNIAGSVPVESFVWPKSPLLLLGEEGQGLTPEIVIHCEHLVAITQRGSVRSLNAGCASSVVMYDFATKLR